MFMPCSKRNMKLEFKFLDLCQHSYGNSLKNYITGSFMHVHLVAN